MTAMPPKLDLLLCDADDRRPLLPSDTLRSGKPLQDQKPHSEQHSFLDESGDPNSIIEQRWGVIAPEGAAGDRLLALVAPLIALREAQQGQPAKIYRVPAKLSEEEASDWKKRVYHDGKTLSIDIPRYQLILGNLDEVGLPTQQIQQAEGIVGRLAFDDDQGYEAYVDKVLRYERSQPTIEQARALFFTVHDGTGATDAGYRSLIAPGIAEAQLRKQRQEFPARELLELGDKAVPSQSELLSQVGGADPSVLFSLSHGAGAPRAGWKSVADQHQRQGAMSFGSDGGLLFGSDLVNRPFLPGGAWFMLACYGAGTPDRSAYRNWLESLQQLGQFGGQLDGVMRGLPKEGERPFIAALPQAVLRNPNGPLGFIGHVDLAWTYSFAELGGADGPDARPAKFISLVRALLLGKRIGLSFRELIRFFESTNTDLSTMYSGGANVASSPAREAKRAHLWMLRQDLAGYILLGDPAAQLPLSPRRAQPTVVPAQASAVASVTTKAADKSPPASTAAANFAAPVRAAGLGIHTEGSGAAAYNQERLELAICKLIIGELPAKQIIRESDLEISIRELTQLSEVYRSGGRAALLSAASGEK